MFLYSRALLTCSLKIAHIEPKKYASDKYKAYDLIDPKKRLIGKAYTYSVERMNRLLRHYLARFTRKTYCQSKSISMIVDSVLLFLYRYAISSIRFLQCLKNSHEAIISPEVYDLAQNELKNRAKGNSNHSSASPFSSKIICGEYGSFYGSKV